MRVETLADDSIDLFELQYMCMYMKFHQTIYACNFISRFDTEQWSH